MEEHPANLYLSLLCIDHPLTDRPYQGSIDHAGLGDYLRVLSVPTRILLLQKLQVPHLASEIRLPAYRRDGRFEDGRSISRQAVEGHLAKLKAVGLVRTRRIERGGRSLELWHVDQARLYSLADEMRRLSLLRAESDLLTAMTAAGADTPGVERQGSRSTGVTLALASGPAEGATFALTGAGPWTIGRVRGPDTLLVPHDPYVSARNALIRHDGGYTLQNIASSRNGTTHNWRLLEPDEEVELWGGDTIGVGRTLLVFRQGSA